MKALILTFSQRGKYLFSALKAPCYMSLGHRPRIAAASQTSAESATQRTVRCDGPFPAWRRMMDRKSAAMNRAFSAGTLACMASRRGELFMNAAPLALTHTGEKGALVPTVCLASRHVRRLEARSQTRGSSRSCRTASRLERRRRVMFIAPATHENPLAPSGRHVLPIAHAAPKGARDISICLIYKYGAPTALGVPAPTLNRYCLPGREVIKRF